MGTFVYLSTAYTFDPEQGHRNAVDALGLCLGLYPEYIFHSPIAHTHIAAREHNLPKSYDGFWQRIDEALIERFDEVWVLLDPDGGWRTSEGMKGEVAFARKIGRPVQFVQFLSDSTGRVDVKPCRDPGIF